MASSSRKFSFSRDQCPSRSPLSPTIIHYRQKYQRSQISHSHRDIKRHHHLRNFSRHSHQNERINKNSLREHSPIRSLWETHQSSNGQIYYYNVVTDQSQWEKPSKEQLSLSITKKSIHSKRISNNNSTKSQRSTSSSTLISDTNVDSLRSRSSYMHHRSFNNINRRKDTTKMKSSLKQFQKDQRQRDEVILSTPISPPENEKIRIDLVDPIPTPNHSNTNISNSLTVSQQQQSDSQVLLIFPDQMKVKSSDSKQNIKRQIDEDLSSTVIQSSLYPSESTINAILELGHSSPIKRQCSSPVVSTTTNFNCDHITRYYRAELIEHLLNWPSTHIEREAIRLSNEQIRYTTCRLTSLRTDLFSIRLRLQQNRFRLLKYHSILVNQQDLLDKLQLIESDQI